LNRATCWTTARGYERVAVATSVLAGSAGTINAVRQPQSRSEEASDQAKPQQTLSQLIARILDQMSVSAWLPSAVVVFALLFVFSLRGADGDVGGAIAHIGELDPGPLVLLLGAVIVTTMITQAFEFEAIRLLEGYWGAQPLNAWFSDVRFRRHLRRRNALRKRARDAEIRAVMAAQPRMLQAGRSPVLVGVLVAKYTGGDFSGVSAADQEAANNLQWKRWAPARELRRWDALIDALEEYPRSDRLVMPTRLGNALRAREEDVLPASVGKLETFVQRVFHKLPVTLQTEHDQFRSRLDLYCSLVVVFCLTGVIATLLLLGLDAALVASSAGIALALAWLSYRAAIASARAYGGLLQVIADVPTSNDVSP
jgi:hypothetical protein